VADVSDPSVRQFLAVSDHWLARRARNLRQRWYTFAGNAQSGQSSIPVTIYQNTGGTFGAPPITNAVAVGTGTLTLTGCTAGTFNYSFNDGRSGSTALTRLTPNVTCVTSGTPPTNPDFGFTGNWYTKATSGQGFVVELNPVSGLLFFTWYTYAVNGQTAGAAGQRWYTGQANNFTPGMRTIAATLYETTGGAFNQAGPPAHTVPVGTATLTFTNCGSATLNYNFTSGGNAGQAGSIALVRIGPTPAGCAP